MNNKINGILAASIATLVATGGVMGTVAEANAASADVSQTMNVGRQALQPDVKNAIEQSNGSNYTVRRSFELTSEERSTLSEMKSNPQRVAAIQSAISSNHKLLKSLAVQNVDLRSIVDVQAAADGGLVVFQS